MKMWTKNTGYGPEIIFKEIKVFDGQLLSEQIPSFLPVCQEFQYGLFQLWRAKEDGLRVYEVEGTFSGSWSHNQRYQWCKLCRLLLHLLPKVDLQYRGILFPPKLRMVPEPQPDSRARSQRANLWIQVNTKMDFTTLEAGRWFLVAILLTCVTKARKSKQERNYQWESVKISLFWISQSQPNSFKSWLVYLFDSSIPV